jgi:flagellar biogenesis protein FliO
MKISTALDTASKQTSPFSGLLERLLEVIKSVRIDHRQRRLRLCENLALGDKRSVAVVEFEDQRFLLGISSSGISLLQCLGPTASAGESARAEHA